MKGFRFPALILVVLVGIFLFLFLSSFFDQKLSRKIADSNTQKTTEFQFVPPASRKGNFVIVLDSVKISNRTLEVFVTLTGEDENQYDTAETLVRIPNQIFEMISISDGPGLDFCPRKQIEKDSVRITCVSQPDTLSGRINQPIFKMRLYLREPFDKGTIRIDETDTKIYFKGQEITIQQSVPLEIHL